VNNLGSQLVEGLENMTERNLEQKWVFLLEV
jgi:hypothetical protein